MALTNAWPLMPSLTGNDITKDIVGGLSLTNVGEVTMTEEGAVFTGANTKALTFTKTLGNTYSIAFYAKSNGVQTGKWSPFMSASTSSGDGTGIFCDAGPTYATSSWPGGRINISDMVTKILDGAEHLHVITYNNGILKYYIDSEAPIIGTSKPSPSEFTFAIGRMGAYVNENIAWNGTVRDVRIYDHELASDEIHGPSASVPTNLTAIAGDSQITLSWDAVAGATGYNVKRSTTEGGPYTTVAANITLNSYVDIAVTNGTTYYYIVTAINAAGESTNSNEASATPIKVQAPTNQGLLRVIMSDSSEREYELSNDEINKFVAWCDRAIGTGNSLYVFNKTYNVGEFKTRKEYLMFEKIISFEVMELTK